MIWYSRLLIAMLAWGALTGGARYPWAYWPLAGTAVALGVIGLIQRRGWSQRNVRSAAWWLGAVAIAIAAQAIPLPYDIFVRLAPAADRFLRTYQFGYAANPPSAHALSIDPALTLTALGLFLALALLLLGLLSVMATMRLRSVVAGMVGLGVLLAVLGIVQRITTGTAPMVYGLWEATKLSTPFGPFFNRNHFAGWMAMVLPVALGYGYAVMEESRHPNGRSATAWFRWGLTPEASQFLIVAFSTLAMGTALVLTGSRSGIGAFALSVVVFGALLANGRSSAGANGRRVALVALAGLLIGAVLWAGGAATVQRFTVVAADLPGRVSAWRDALRIAADFPWFGCGLGTFGRAMLVYQSGDRIAFYAQAHNDYVQVLAEGGALVVIPAAASLSAFAWRARQRLRAEVDDDFGLWIRYGAVAGLAGIAAQSVMEYSLQRPGNTAMCVVLMALALHKPSPRTGAYAHRV